jgi:quercetin dioxygenase-like cupin family protein
MKKEAGMRRLPLLLAAAALAVALSASAQPAKAPAGGESHVLIRTAEVKWGEAPAKLPKGAQLAVLSGDPGAAGPFAIRLKFPAGYRIPPHWHPTAEQLTVLSGDLSMATGEKFDKTALKPLGAGGYSFMPAEMRHFGWSRAGAVVQVQGMGPFVLNYVNPADDPTQPKTMQ